MRPIDISSFNPVILDDDTDAGPAPQLQWIDIKLLVVDEAYQRPISSQGSRTNVRHIAEHFDWRRFAPVIVSPIAGGLYAIVDGQHRSTGAALRGIDKVPCCVIHADRKEQARAFEAINGKITRVTPLQIYKARLAAGEPLARRIDAVLAAAAVRMMVSNRSATQMEPDETLALSALTRVLATAGDEVLRIALKAIRASAGDRRGFLSGQIILSVAEVLADHPEWAQHPELLTIMPRIHLLREQDKAALRMREASGTIQRDHLEASLVTFFEKHLPGARHRLAQAAE